VYVRAQHWHLHWSGPRHSLLPVGCGRSALSILDGLRRGREGADRHAAPERPRTGVGLGTSPPLLPYSPQMPSLVPREQHNDGWSLRRCPLLPAPADGTLLPACHGVLLIDAGCPSVGGSPPAPHPAPANCMGASLPARPQALRAGARDGRTHGGTGGACVDSGRRLSRARYAGISIWGAARKRLIMGPLGRAVRPCVTR
jgi:hypothetical protein